MRKKIIAGNWKMNTNLLEGIDLANKVSGLVEKIDFDQEKFQMIIAPPHTHLYSISSVLNKKIDLSSQNIAAYENGAYTGEISADIIKNTGAKCAILGHSERRAYFGENNDTLSTKLQLALKYNLTPIFCIGEVLEERDAGKQFEVVEEQIKNVLFELNTENFSKVIVAYEPVWAIGTGKTASPEQAQEIHAFIRKLISDKYGLVIAENTSILYGGSCKPANADGLFSQPDIDGGLIGGASLKAEDFTKLL
ncbi:MAG: triose-phosphate isomerase, partial [Bacteroidota bacterium]|nr:triose-phosphate isomerase [Bacteroidota bacterium]